jgi:uncharacterized membrane protein YccC
MSALVFPTFPEIKLPFFPPLSGSMVAFAVRNFLASMLALYIAFVLQLDTPVWAWLTVWIVAQPTPGMMLSKSLYRIIGTISGAIGGVVLIALFAQTPELFVVALAAVVGGCTVASNVLTNFRAYATVLAGYTAAVVASDAINAPDQIFFIAMARGAAILIGIGSAVVVTSIFAPHHSEETARKALLALLKDAAWRASYPWHGPQEERIKVGSKLITDVIAVNTLIEFAAAESGVFRLQSNNARSLLAHLFGMISARRALDAHLLRVGWPKHNPLIIFHGVILDFLKEMPGELDAGRVDGIIRGLQDVCHQVNLLEPERDTTESAELVSERFVIDRLDDLLGHLEGALQDWRDILNERWEKEPRKVLNFHRDLRAALINGLRAFVAVCAAGAFWIGSAWVHGPGALVFVAIMLSLFSTQARPDRVGWAFFKASIPAVFLGLICRYYFLPLGSGFDFLVIIAALFLLPMGLVMAHPRTNAAAVAFSLIFLNIVGPTNPQGYDLADSINSALAIEIGVLFGTLAYVLIFPPNPAAARRYVTFRIRRGVELLAALEPIPDASAWESRMYDRVSRLYDPQNLSGSPTDEWLEAGLGALTMGKEILRLRTWLATEALPAEVRIDLQKTLATFGHFRRDPLHAAMELEKRRAQVAQLDPGQGRPERRAWARIQGALEEMDVYLAHHPRFLKLESLT